MIYMPLCRAHVTINIESLQVTFSLSLLHFRVTSIYLMISSFISSMYSVPPWGPFFLLDIGLTTEIRKKNLKVRGANLWMICSNVQQCSILILNSLQMVSPQLSYLSLPDFVLVPLTNHCIYVCSKIPVKNSVLSYFRAQVIDYNL